MTNKAPTNMSVVFRTAICLPCFVLFCSLRTRSLVFITTIMCFVIMGH